VSSASPSKQHNGNTRDRQGRLVSCEHDARRVTRTGARRTITFLADRYQGKLLNSPNDVVCKSTGSSGSAIRPSASSETTKATSRRGPGAADQRLPGRRSDGRGHGGHRDIPRPNGLCFIRRVQALRGREGACRGKIRVFDVVAQGRRWRQPRLRQLRRRNSRRDALRRRRQPLVRLGGGDGLDGVSIFNHPPS